MSPAAGQTPATWIRTVTDGLRLAVRVTPRAADSKIVGIETDGSGACHLAVRLRAPPTDGKANDELIRLLARRWRVAQSALSLLAGAGARRKVVHVAGEPETLQRRLRAIEGESRERPGGG